MCMHASKHGPGRMGAGGCTSGAWAEELVLGRGVKEAMCLQVSADSNAQRMYR